jgi:hypothetical protein
MTPTRPGGQASPRRRPSSARGRIQRKQWLSEMQKRELKTALQQERREQAKRLQAACGVLMLELVDVDSRKKSSASASTSASEEVVVVGDAKVRVGEALFTEWSGGVVPAAFVKLAALGKAGRKRDAAAKKQWKSSVKGLQMQMREISTGVWTLTVRASSSSSSSSSPPLVIAMKRES